MLLKVKPLNSEIISIEIDENSKVEELEEKILDLTGISADTYRLVYKGRILKKESIINTLDINGTIFMVKTSKSKDSKPANESVSSSNPIKDQFPTPPQTNPYDSVSTQGENPPPPQSQPQHFPTPPSSLPPIQNSNISSFRDSFSSSLNLLNQSQRNITNINSTISSHNNNNHLSLQLQQQKLLLGQILHRMSSIYMNSISPLIITSNTLLNNNIPSDAIRNLVNILNDINKINKMCSDVIMQYKNMISQMNYEGTVIVNENNNDVMNNIVELGSNIARDVIRPLIGTGTNSIFHSVLRSVNDTIFDMSRMNGNGNRNNGSNHRNDNQIHHHEETD